MTIVPLEHLHDHPENANRMTRASFRKLVKHIRESGCYPPIVVRPIHCKESSAQQYQILDGHHRAATLRELKMTEASCDVWNVDDDQARLLLLTLNRLHGVDHPAKRAALVQSLMKGRDVQSLSKLLPDSSASIRKLMSFSASPPRISTPPSVADMPRAITFFLNAQHMRRLKQLLNGVSKNRSDALVELLNLNGTDT